MMNISLQRDSFLRQAKHTMKFLPEDIMRLAFIFQREFIQLEAQDGESAIYLIDDENGIYIWQQIGNDPENPNQAAVMDDLRLYDGALLEVKSGAALQFRSDCAQTEKASWRDKSTAGFSASRSRTDNDCGA